jgi:hypothetical protein
MQKPDSAMDEISINTTTTGDQDQPGVAGFRGTQFAVVWADHGSGDIKGQMLGVNAVPSGDEFTVNFPQRRGPSVNSRPSSKPAAASSPHGSSRRRGLRRS